MLKLPVEDASCVRQHAHLGSDNQVGAALRCLKLRQCTRRDGLDHGDGQFVRFPLFCEPHFPCFSCCLGVCIQLHIVGES